MNYPSANFVVIITAANFVFIIVFVFGTHFLARGDEQ
jgi:hypothetical protein